VTDELPAADIILRSDIHLPPPRPEFVDAIPGEDSGIEHSFFHPERWDEQFTAWQGSDKHDPVASRQTDRQRTSRALT
jgi:hypothetical protein